MPVVWKKLDEAFFLAAQLELTIGSLK